LLKAFNRLVPLLDAVEMTGFHHTVNRLVDELRELTSDSGLSTLGHAIRQRSQRCQLGGCLGVGSKDFDFIRAVVDQKQ